MKPITVATFLLLYCFALQAQTNIPAPDSLVRTQLGEIVISANRAPASGFRSPEQVKVLTQKEIRHMQARTTPEALLRTTGVWVQKTNHGGGSPFVCGLTGNQTLLLIDGIRLNNATFRYGPNQYFNTIDPFSIGRIEVLKGNGSVQYGSDAFGGAIQVFTRDPGYSDKTKLHGGLIGRIATQGMEKSLHADAGLSGQQFGIVAGYSERNFGDLVGGDTTGRQTPTGYRERAFDVKAKIRLSGQWELTAAHQQVQQFEVPVFHKIRLENFAVNEFAPQNRFLSYLKTAWKPKSGTVESAELILGRQFSREGRNSQKNGSTLYRREEDKVQTLNAILQINTRFGANWTAQHGAEVYHDHVGSTRRDTDQSTGTFTDKRGLYPDNSTMLSYGVFSLHEYLLGKWTFNAGLRWNAYAIRVQDTEARDVLLQPNALVGNLGLLRTIGAHWASFASFNTGFRTPNIDDLGTLGIVDFRYEVPNYDLKPEKSYNTQAGVRMRRENLHWEIVVYRNELRNLIARVKQDTQMIQGYPVYLKENVDKAYIQGLESDFRWRIVQNLSLEGGIAYTFGQNISAREPMRRIPPLNGRLALRYERRFWFAGAEMLSAGRQDRLAAGDVADNRIPAGGTPGWTVFNLMAGFGWRHVSFTAVWQNIGNVDYRYHGSGVNGVGRSGSFQARISF